LDAVAQNSTGRIVGVITDPSGAVVGGAQVVVTNTATNVRSETLAGADGKYQVVDLPNGSYTVSVQKEGFATVVTQPSELQINQTLRVDIHLAVGAVTQTVGVEAQATQVETEIPTVGGTVSGATIQNLPLNGRDTLDLALTQPGVIPALVTSAGASEYHAGTFTIGGTFGGPIVKDKLFYYFGYQGQRQSSVIVNPGVGVFTPAELGGDFSHAVNGGPDPGLVQFLQANPYFQPNPQLASQAIIAPARINPVSQTAINAGLVPTSPNGVQIPQGAATDNRDEYNGKLDFYATQNDRISATVGWANRNDLNPYPFLTPNAGFPGLMILNQRGINIAYTKTISPTLINEARATAQRYIQDEDVPPKALPSASALGITGLTAPAPGDLSSPAFTFDIGLNLGNPLYPELLTDTTYTFSDTVTWIRGRHTLKAGFSFNKSMNNTGTFSADAGDYYFYGVGGVGTGTSSFADFLLGIPTAFTQGEQGRQYPRTKGYWAFVQDEWKVMPRLTLTLGLRYEFNTPVTDKRGYNAEIIPGVQSQRFVNAPPGLVAQGDPGTPSGLYYPDHKEFAPRFGFAWDPRGNGRTSLRGGFGVFDDNIQGQTDFYYSASTPPFWIPGTNPNSSTFGLVTQVNPNSPSRILQLALRVNF
jgi:hypothetical protein